MLILIKSAKGGKRFGGFRTKSFESKWKDFKDKSSFIF